MTTIPFFVQIILVLLVLAVFLFALHAFTGHADYGAPETFENATTEYVPREEINAPCTTNEKDIENNNPDTEKVVDDSAPVYNDSEEQVTEEHVAEMYKTNPYGYTITEPSQWDVPYARQPPCLPKEQPVVMPVFTDGVPMNALDVVPSS